MLTTTRTGATAASVGAGATAPTPSGEPLVVPCAHDLDASTATNSVSAQHTGPKRDPTFLNQPHHAHVLICNIVAPTPGPGQAFAHAPAPHRCPRDQPPQAQALAHPGPPAILPSHFATQSRNPGR
jgi:hypothetical protein